MALGADKVVINTGALDCPELITDIARQYGAQCVVVAIDARRTEDGAYEVMAEFGRRPTGLTPAEWAKRARDLGAGEVMVTSIERDGSLEGYELPLCRQVVDAVDIPVLICGGAGNWGHFRAGFEQGGADAVCTANIYHFTDTAIRSAKQYLAKAGILVRTE
jgi:cyclase